jgi:CRP-like cAMP-binding protein
MTRQFTVQALSDVEVLTFSTKNLQRMEQEFNSDFLEIFASGEDLLRRFLTQKLRAIHNSSRNRHLIHDEESEFKRRFQKSSTMRNSNA